LLKALGADVIVCPTAVPPDDPRSYHSVAKKLAQDIPNSYFPNQYDNPSNPEAHYRSTGPELWEESEGRITHFVCGMGTGGTITGVGRYLKEKNPKVQIVGADPAGSILYEFFHKGTVGKAETYKVEGIGEDFFPAALDFSVIDDIIRVTDKDSFLWTRRLARAEAIFAGGSAGTAIGAVMALLPKLAKDDFVVVLIPDTGMRYLSKVYNNEWMRDNRYSESSVRLTAGEIVAGMSEEGVTCPLVYVAPSDSVAAALERMRENDFSQLPVFEDGKPVGALYEDKVLSLALEGKDLKKVVVREVMGEAFPVVAASATVDQITSCITRECPAVFVSLGNGKFDIITKYDLLHAIAHSVEET
ncbi:MAG: pyridoxal-phosphate dependent enzyme, partial [Deltaproteobacteria bacterium]